MLSQLDGGRLAQNLHVHYGLSAWTSLLMLAAFSIEPLTMFVYNDIYVENSELRTSLQTIAFSCLSSMLLDFQCISTLVVYGSGLFIVFILMSSTCLWIDEQVFKVYSNNLELPFRKAGGL